jgi:hypothetical protein
MRYIRVHNVASVLQISNAEAAKDKGAGIPADGGIYSIHDIVADGIHGEDYRGGGVFLILLSNAPPVHDVQINHVTSFGPGPLLSIQNLEGNDKIHNFTITNSVFAIDGPRFPVASAGGGPGSCAQRNQARGPQAVLEECFSPYKFEGNLIISPRGGGGWPSGNFIVGSAEDAGIHDLKDLISSDPRLCHEKGPGCGKKSPGVGAATDGRDSGADVEGVEAAVAGIE